MKILHLINDLGFGGAETLLMSYVPSLTEYEHVIVTVTDENVFKKVTDQYRYISLNSKPVKDFFSIAKRLRKIIIDEKIDIVHSHSYWTNIVSRLATPRSVRLINHYHFADYDTRINNYKVKLQLQIDKLAKHPRLKRIAVSDYVLRILNKSFKGGDNSCIHNFTRSDNGVEAIKPFTPDNTMNIVAVGSAKHEKGYELLIQAFEKLKDYPIHMDVYGDGPLLQQYIDAVKVKGIIGLQFRGAKKATHELFRQYDLYCSTSVSETFGVTLLEAMDAGLPMLLSDIKAFREIAPSSCCFFEMNNVDDFTAKILEIYYNGISPNQEDYNKVLHKYSKRSFLRAINELYTEKRLPLIVSPLNQSVPVS